MNNLLFESIKKHPVCMSWIDSDMVKGLDKIQKDYPDIFKK
jgi:hypothetical protein